MTENSQDQQGHETMAPPDSPDQLQALLTFQPFASNEDLLSYSALKDALHDDPKAASRLYEGNNGEIYAIQFALQNRRSLLDRGLTEGELKRFCTRLVFMNPSALLLKHESKNGAKCAIEFQIIESIVNWIVQAHFKKTPRNLNQLMRMNSHSSSVDEYLKWESSLFQKVEHNGRKSKNFLHVEAFSPSFDVPITEDVKFLLILLSNVMDEIVNKDDQDDESYRSILATQTIPGEQMSVGEIVMTLAIHLAAVPAFVKTILLCKEADAEKLFNLTFVKHVMLEKESAGIWVKLLLKTHPDKALMYFNVLSRFLDEDVSGLVDMSSQNLRMMEWKGEDVPTEVSLVQDKRDKFLDYMMKHHFNSVLHIVSTRESLLLEAAKNRFVQRMVDQYVQRDFLLSQVAFDFIFYIFLCVGYQTMTISFIVEVNASTYLVASELSVFGAVYFLLRKGTQLIAEFRGWAGFKKQILLNMWHWFEWISIILTIYSHYYIDNSFAPDENFVVAVSAQSRHLIAITTLFQLLHFVSFIRKANEDIAVFIVSLEKILYNVRWFFLILALTVATFAQMFMAVLSGENPPRPCGATSFSPFDDYDDAVFNDCEVEYEYARAYQMMLGDWDTSDFGTTFSYSIFVLFSFFVSLILGNILVAIACDSYAEAKEDGPSIFRAERIDLCAESTSLELYLSKSIWGDRRTIGASLILFSAAILVSYQSAESAHDLLPSLITLEHPNILFFGGIAFIVCLVVIAWGVFFSTAVNNDRECDDGERANLFRRCFSLIALIFIPLGRLYIGGPIEDEASEENDDEKGDGLTLELISELFLSKAAHSRNDTERFNELKNMIAILATSVENSKAKP